MDIPSGTKPEQQEDTSAFLDTFKKEQTPEEKTLSTGDETLDYLNTFKPKEEQPTNSDIVSGLQAGTHHMVNLIENQGAAAMYGILNKFTGDPDYQAARDAYSKKYQENAVAIEKKYPRNVESFSTAKSIGDYVDVAQRDVAEGIPMLLGLSPAALVAPEAGLSAMVAAAIPDVAIQSLQSDAELKANGVDSMGAALLMGAAKHGLNYLGKVQALQKFFGTELEHSVTNTLASKVVSGMTGGKLSEAAANKVGNIIGGFVKDGVSFAPAGMAQTAVDQAGTALLADNKDFLTKENLASIMETGVAGFLTGGLLGSRHTLLKGGKGPDEIIQQEQQHAEDKIKNTKITDVGSASKYLADNNLDSTVFSSDDTMIAAANRLKSREAKQSDLSPALGTLRMEPNQLRIEGPKNTVVEQATETDTFFKQRAEEMRNQAILAQPEAQNLVARGLPPETVTKLPPAKIQELSERINKSYDSVSKQELDQHVVDSSGNVMDQRTADARKAEMDAFKQSIKDNKAENANKLNAVLQRMQKAFIPGDGMVVSPTENDAFIGKLQDAYEAKKTEDSYKTMLGKEPSKDSITSKEPITALKPEDIWKKMGGKKNHPIPESVRTDVVKTPEPVKEPPKTTTQPEQLELPIVMSSKNSPENDSRVMKQEADRTARNKDDSDKTRFQLLQPQSTEEAQLHRSSVMPTMVFNNMRMTPPSHEFRGRAAEAINNLARIVKEVAGPHAEFRPVEILQSLDPYTAEPVSTLRGAQYRNLIFTSMEHINNPNTPLTENALHEVWHMLANDTNVFTPADKKLIELEHPKISKYVRDSFAIPEGELDLMSRTPEGRDEINATAFGLYANNLRSGTPVEALTSPVKTLFRKAINLFSKFGNYLRGAGFRNYEDMFKAVNSGERQANASDFHDNALNEIRQVRLQKISEEVQKEHMKEQADKISTFKRDMDAAMDESMKYRLSNRFGKPVDAAVAARNSWFRTAMGLAHQYEAWRIPVQMGIDLQNKVRGYGTRYSSLHDSATKGYTKEQIHSVHDLMDKLGKTGQAATFEYLPTGQPDLSKMTYNEVDPATGQSQLKVSLDKSFNRAYFQTKEQFKQVNNDFENPIRNTLENHGVERNIPLKELENLVSVHQKDVDMLQNQEESIKNDLKSAKKTGNEERIKLLEDAKNKIELQRKDKQRWLEPVDAALQNLRDIDSRRNVDYAPQMRFGPYGITVWAKKDLEPHPVTGKLRPVEGRKSMYHGQIERIKMFEKSIAGTDASADQHREHLKEIKRQGLDGKDYVTFGADKPFFLTQNAIGNYINSRSVNAELMYSLMNDKNMDAYVSMMKHIQDTTSLKGFAKHFSERQNIPGYSKDWTRVTPKYLTSAANYIGRREVAPDLITYQAKVDTMMQDSAMKKDLMGYLNYMNGPTEDYLAAREMNYLWALGMNPISAALQAMTLPTSTHMSMNTYSPSPIKNAGYISKWFGKAISLSKQQHVDMTTGMLTNDFADRKVVDALIAKKFFDKDPAKNQDFGDFMHKMATEGRLEGFYKNDMASKAARGHDTAGDKTYHALKKASNFSGIALGFMETATRIATVMAHYDMVKSEKGVMDRANRVLKNDKVFQSLLKDTRFTPEQHLALFGMDEAHAVFSKAARGKFQRGIAGVLMPFTQYPVQVTEHMIRQLGRGPEARAALAMNLGMLVVLSGALGLPGANILKDASEFAYKQATGHNVDLEEAVREKLTDMGMTPAMSLMMTQGFSRPVLGLDLGKRIGFGDAIPTADLALSLFGIRGNSVLDSMGVQGSIVKNAGLAWNDYNNGASATEIAAKLAPSAVSNALQGYNYGKYGVKTAKGDMLIPPSKVTMREQLEKGIGISPGTVSDARENTYFTRMKENEWTDFIGHNTKLLASLRTQRIQATKDRDSEKASAALQKEQEVISSLRKWQKDTGYPLNFTSMNSNIKRQVQTNLTGKKPLKDVKKAARKSVAKIKAITNISGDSE